MAEHDCISEGKIAKAERRCIVGYRPKGGDRSTPQVNIAGKWLAEAGFAVGTGVSLKVLDGCLVLIPDSREETRLRREQAQLEQQKREMEQTRQQALALLAKVSG
ncbi:type I toxin-antitoxin system SymE family toxin [Erwinia tracheiphila]|uniref:Growth inhibitor PemK n=1 Tax=Erwinia tracheiphila TaxID=65700 RepID=A0A0M2KF94_9GAMM|nr:SymE family type I addiction module toxin [Erwinia tracheiphila]KKF36008.1 growth inhibitor PemK [Erwinia tracheiphila]KKF36012.1 growth inhibitor PemK [Erwinia tracheiphila]KKF36389.1 growth inhibitor PemK [Erwinia tracheiphila]UIA87323.1 type I toxin-antitoxin system SymE family toxin [Erwinia tracheiphila]UIA87331.1 type I toxin-antitoxin system SymE family toxin [Erwinia tracheiphila]